MQQSARRRTVAALVALALLLVGVVAAAPSSSGITLTPAVDGATAVRSGMGVRVGGAVDLGGGSSFIVDAELIGYDAEGNEFVRGNALFNANRSSGTESSPEYIDIDAEGNVDGLLELGCEFGDATSLEQDQVVPPCDGQTTTAWDMQLVLVTPDAQYHSELIRVDPVPPVIERYEVTSPTTIVVTVSEPVVHPTGRESSNDWVLPDGEATVVGVQRHTDDCEYGPDEDPRGGADGCTFTLTVTPALPRDATPRVRYEPSETRVTNPDDAKHVDMADNSMYLRSVEPTRGDRFNSLAADRVGPVPPSIQSIAGNPSTDPDTGERTVLDNEPQPQVGIGDVAEGHPVEVHVDGTTAGSGTAGPTGATVTLDSALADGVYSFTATASDTADCDPNDPSAGTCSNDSEPSQVVTYDLDTVAPQVTGEVLARSSTITIAFTEEVSGPDDPADWSVSNPGGAAVSVDAVEDDGDGSAARRLRISGGPVVLGAELTYAPAGDAYQDRHTNALDGVTVPLTIAELPIASVDGGSGDETADVLGRTTPAQFTIELDEPMQTGESGSVDYEVVALGSATVGAACDPGVDAVITSGTAMFDGDSGTSTPAQTSAPIPVEVCADALDEFDTESIVLELSNPQGLRLAGSQDVTYGVATITDDDLPPTVDFADPSPEIGEGQTKTFLVELDAPSGKPVRVRWTTAFDLSANDAGAHRDDLPDQSGTIDIPAGQTQGEFEVFTLSDLEVEDGERFALELDTSAADAHADEPDGGARVAVDIIDDDVAVPTVQLTGGEVDEDARGDLFLVQPGSVDFRVELDQAVNRTVRVDYTTTANGSATANDEFTPTSGTLEFEPGDTVGLVSVEIADDQLDERDETVELELSKPDGEAIAFPAGAPGVAAFGMIRDDDPLAEAAFADDSVEVSIEEGADAQLTVELDTVSGKDVAVDWATRYDGGEQGATDADAPQQSGTVVIEEGSTSVSFPVGTTSDDSAEGDETFQVELVAATDGALADDGRPLVATVRILDDEVVLPTLTIEGGDVAEDAPAVPPLLRREVSWTLTLSEATEQDVTVEVRTVAGDGDATTDDATAGDDYLAGSATVTIPAGERSAEFAVEVVDDELFEFTEVVPLVASDLDGARLPGGAEQTDPVPATITDDDPAPTVSLGDDVDVDEGEAATLTVELSAASGKDVTVAYQTRSDGGADDATADSDYDTSSGEVTIAAGTTSTTFSIQTNDDAADEPSEPFHVDITLVTQDTADLGDATATVTVLDNDVVLEGPPVVTLSGATVSEGDPLALPLLPTTTMTFDVGLSRAAEGRTTIQYETVAGDAAAGEDYEQTSGSVTIADGDDSATIDVGVFPDAIDEFDETFTLRVTGVSDNAQRPGELARDGVIEDDDPLATVAFADASATVEVDEGNAATFTVELEGATEKDVTVEYATSHDGPSGSAAGTDDVPSQTGTVTIPAGATTETFTIGTEDDDQEEVDETLSVVLSTPGNAKLDPERATSATLRVLDDEVNVPTLDVDRPTVDEGDGLEPLTPAQLTWTFTLDETAPVDVTAEFRTDAGGGTATAGDDYTGRSGTVTIPAGEASASVSIDVVDDDLDEFIEEVDLVIDDVVNAQLPGGVDAITRAGRITDDDPVVSVALGDDQEVAEGNPATFDVLLSGPSGKPVTVSYQTVPAGATAGDDYEQASGELTIPAGAERDTFSIDTVDDFIEETDEDVTVELTVESTDSAELGDATATLTITSDDVDLGELPVVGLNGASIDEGDPVAGVPLLTTELSFEVLLSKAAVGDVVIDYATAPGTALAGDDYASSTGRVTIPEGDTSAEITVQVEPDALDEFDEALGLELTGVTENAQLPPGGLERDGRILDDDPLAVVGFDDATMDVGVTEGGEVELHIERAGATAKPVSVQYTISFDGGATADDAPAQSGTVELPADGSAARVRIDTVQDTVDEPAERFSVVLSDPTNATLDGDTDVATITINDDDLVLPTLSVDGGVVDEGAAGPLGTFAPAMIAFMQPGGALATPLEEALVLTVTLSEPAEQDVTVDHTTVDTGTAEAGSDYAASSGTVTIPAGETETTISVDALDDALDEFDELVHVRFSNLQGATFSNGASTLVAAGRISDDDPLVTVELGEDVEVTEGDPATFEVTLSAASGKDIEVRHRTSDGTARASQDYRATDDTFTIPAGDTSATFTVPTVDDATAEPTEELSVALSVVGDETAELGRSTGTLEITDDDLGVDPDATVVSLTGAAADEGDPFTPLQLPLGGNALEFVVQLSEPADGDVTIDYVTRAGTAAADDDFTPASGQVTIADGQDEATVAVDIIGDFTDEFEEDLRLVLTGVSGDAVLPNGELARTGRILDDDPEAQLRVSDATVLEGDVAELDVTLDNPSGKDITVDWRLADGSATADEDYAVDSGTLSFPAGTTSRTVQVATLADGDTGELIERFELVLSAASNAGIDDARGAVSIVDIGVDGLPTVTAVFLEDITTQEADGDRTALVPVRLSGERDQDTTVTWSSQQLTATDGDDYRAGGGQVVIPAGSTSAQIAVAILGDQQEEPNEDFLVLLTQADGAIITGPTGRVTIEDDDAVDDGGSGDGGGDDAGDEDGLDGAPDGGSGGESEPGELAATGGGAGFAVFGLALLAARRRREDD